jgi:ClpA/ClpB-like protein
MFERYTEKARRVIFFARYEASQYGSPYIETEHILLGLLREDYAMVREFLGPNYIATQIRAEVEKLIKLGKPFPTNVEVPLSAESKKILELAFEEARRLAQKHVGTEHFLLAILRLPDSLAAKVLLARGAKPDAIREQIAKTSGAGASRVQPVRGALVVLDAFLGALKAAHAPGEPAAFFHERGQFIDSSGKRWVGRQEISKAAETLFAPFAKKNATFFLEDTISGPSDTVVASALWEFAAVSAGHSKTMLRMSIVLAPAGEDWEIVLAQVTPLLPGLKLSVE